MNFFTTIGFSWYYLTQSLQFLGLNKDLLFFPLLSLIATLGFLALTLITGIIELPLLEFLSQTHFVIVTLFFFALYFILSFIIFYFNASLIAVVIKRLEGESASLSLGFKMAAKQWIPILEWSLISATVGLIIRTLENSHNALEELIGYLLGGAWSVGAYFVIPIILMEKKGPFQALKQGYHVFGRGWRKVIGVTFIFTLIFALIAGIVIGLLHLFPTEKKLIFDVTLAMVIISILFMATLGTLFNSIVCSALYLNIMQNKTPPGFAPEMLSKAFQHKHSFLK